MSDSPSNERKRPMAAWEAWYNAECPVYDIPVVSAEPPGGIYGMMCKPIPQTEEDHADE